MLERTSAHPGPRAGASQLTLQIQLLGEFRVSVDGRSIPAEGWRFSKARNIIKLLALAPSHRLHREQILETLWPGFDPAAAANNLGQILHFARHTLEPDLPRGAPSSFLRFQGKAIVLGAPDGLDVDVQRFEAAVELARQHDDPETLSGAADLYAGELLPEDMYEEWTISRREQLRLLYIETLMRLARAYEGRGLYEKAIETLQRVVRSEPAHEEAHARLMRLYALTGRRHRALRQFEALQDTLRRDLGVTPDPASRSLYEAIVAGEHAAVEGGPVRAGTIQVRTNLPAPLTTFVGREDELAEVSELVSSSRLVTLTGVGGCGKTRLALEMARRMLSGFTHGVWVVDIGSLADRDLLPGMVARLFGIKWDSRSNAADILMEQLAGRHLLLILDNCEHLTGACADLAAGLLQASGRLRVLATSRTALGMEGELLYRVRPLAVPDEAAQTSPDAVTRYDAVRLFLERVRLVRPEFRLDAHNAADVAEICRSLDGLPLAIELAAARLRRLALRDVVGGIADRFRLLATRTRPLHRRHQTMLEAIDWSYDLLGKEEQTLFARLAVFAGGFTLRSAEPVCGDGAVAAETVLELLSGLVDKSMIEAQERLDGSIRYRMLDTLREYARSRLEADAEAQAIFGHHASFFADLADQATVELAGPRQGAWLETLEVEHDNLRAAIGWSLAAAPEMALRMVAALGRFWEAHGYFVEGQRLAEAVLGRTCERTALRGRALLTAAALARGHSDYGQARRLAAESLEIFQETGDRSGTAFALNSLGLVASDQGDLPPARAFFEDSLAIFRGAADEAGEGLALSDLALSAYRQADYPAAEALFRETLAKQRALGNKTGLIHALRMLARIGTKQGAYADARPFLEESLGLCRELGDRQGLARGLELLGDIYRYQGDHNGAGTAYRDAAAQFKEIGDRRGLAICLEDFAMLAIARSEFLRGLRLVAAAAALRSRIDARPGPSHAKEVAEMVGVSRSRLGSAAHAAWAEGEAMPLEQAVMYALTLESQ